MVRILECSVSETRSAVLIREAKIAIFDTYFEYRYHLFRALMAQYIRDARFINVNSRLNL